MRYHNRMMSIQHPPHVEDWDYKTRITYKEGHRDARHAAAEIALSADAEIEQLQARVEKLATALKGILDVANVRIDDPRSERFDAARAALAMELLECPMCGELNAFKIDSYDPALGYCRVEDKSFRIQLGPNAPKFQQVK